MTNLRPDPPNWQGKWYSVCSIHKEYKSNCHICNVGRWISDDETEFSHWLFVRDPQVWKEWANRPDSESRRFIEMTFPNITDKKSY